MSDETAATQEEAQATKPKAKAAKSQAQVTVVNRTTRAHVVIDSEGRGVHIPPKGRVSLAQDRISAEFTRMERRGVLRIA